MYIILLLCIVVGCTNSRFVSIDLFIFFIIGLTTNNRLVSIGLEFYKCKYTSKYVSMYFIVLIVIGLSNNSRFHSIDLNLLGYWIQWYI